MKYLICSCIAIFFFFAASFAQDITLKPDSVALLLCKKWESDYAMMNGEKIGKMPGVPDMNYEFYKDHTFLLITTKDKIKGTWKYIATKKLIELSNAYHKSDLNIISLKSDEMIILAEMKDGPPGEQMKIKLVYKVKSN